MREVAAFLPIIYTGNCDYAEDVKKAATANLRAGLLKPIQDGKMEWKESYGGQWMMLLDGSAIDKKANHHPQTGRRSGSTTSSPTCSRTTMPSLCPTGARSGGGVGGLWW